MNEEGKKLLMTVVSGHSRETITKTEASVGDSVHLVNRGPRVSLQHQISRRHSGASSQVYKQEGKDEGGLMSSWTC